MAASSSADSVSVRSAVSTFSSMGYNWSRTLILPAIVMALWAMVICGQAKITTALPPEKSRNCLMNRRTTFPQTVERLVCGSDQRSMPISFLLILATTSCTLLISMEETTVFGSFILNGMIHGMPINTSTAPVTTCSTKTFFT